jgi:hypothetical protein
MSLLFEYAVDRFAVEQSSLCPVDEHSLDASGETIPVRPIAEFAGHHDSLQHPSEDWICIPLHEEDSAVLSDTFVAYTDHAVRGSLFLVRQDGAYETVSADEFGTTNLARRLRFWHSDYLPETYPSGYDSPIDDREPPRESVDPESLLAGFHEYVEHEREATRKRNRERARERDARVIYEQNGGAIPSVACHGTADDGRYRFRVTLDTADQTRRGGDWAYFVENEFGLYEGNEVLIHITGQTNADTAFPIAARIERIRGLNHWLSIDWGEIDETAAVGSALSSGGEFGISQLLNPVPFDRERDAIDALSDDALLDVLAGQRPVTFSNEASARSSSFDDALNQEQELAVEYALLADDCFCIHGPPGTGKTRTLLEIVRRAVEAGEDVLVCADSNQAVDNLVAGGSTSDAADEQSLHAHAQFGTGEFTLDRVNAARSSNELVRTCYRDVGDRAEVVAATNSSAGTLAREFDLLVLDEATQATCIASCIPLARADRVVLAGDHRQLPPFSATEDAPETSDGLSLFEHLYADGGVFEGVGLQLKTQYRMHRDIAYFPNRAFYDRRLRNGRTVATLPDRPALQGFSVGGTVETIDHSKVNHTEARLVAHLVQDLQTDVPLDEIGVITPYAAQVGRIRDLLADSITDGSAVTVDTIDSFQGSEKTAIVISLVRSNSDGEIGFLGRPEDGPRRLNVALTRARQYCAVVGDFHTLRYANERKCESLYQDFHDYFTSTGRLKTVDPDFIPV